MSAPNRYISEAEIARLPVGFVAQFDVHKVQFIDRAHNPFARNKILCRGYDLYWQTHPTDFTRETLLIQSLLVHELCHVWQYETGRLTAFRYLINPRNWFYSYRVSNTSSFDDYPTEKQADLLQDWFLVNSNESPARYDRTGPVPTRDWLNRVVPFKWDRR